MNTPGRDRPVEVPLDTWTIVGVVLVAVLVGAMLPVLL
jgi:hypothetical protein